MLLYREKIRQTLNSRHKLEFHINHKPLDKDTMNKKIFIETLEVLKKIEDRRDFMEDEIGLDMTLYEDKFMQVIENLFRLAFNDSQVALIKLYLYELVPDKEWDGTITVEEKEKETQVKFKTPNDVWKVLKKLEDK